MATRKEYLNFNFILEQLFEAMYEELPEPKQKKRG